MLISGHFDEASRVGARSPMGIGTWAWKAQGVGLGFT